MSDENNIVLVYNEGVKAYKERKYWEAAAKFLECFKKDKKDPQIRIALSSSYNNYAVLLYKEKKYEESFSFFKKAIELEPINQVYKENFEIAKKKLNIIKLQNLLTEAYVLFQNKKYEKALQKLIKAKELDQNNNSIAKAIAACYNAIGIKYYLQKKFKNALKYFELAKQTYSQNYKYLENIKIVQQIIAEKAISS